MLTDLSELKGFDFSKKYFEINNIYDYYEIREYLTQLDEYKFDEGPFVDYAKIEDIEDIGDSKGSISDYVEILIYAKEYYATTWNEAAKLAKRSGHIKYDCIDTIHHNLLVVDLQKILKTYDLKVSGRKSELISRIEENLSIEQIEEVFPENSPKGIYVLTKKGEKFLEKYSVYWFKFEPSNFTPEEFEVICKNNSQYSAEEIYYCITHQPWIKIDESKFNNKELKEMGYEE
ncbi:SAP domain-containing protein [uncultured Methanobrevibacter sp.]|uniref:SAP domain-containing protein n=1 Tax=uncultured Methanobrevibacter sp. TaxID=253161 RepID=UPI00261919E4|nr:SAP domain-containing protein [uncultured Methanobrevibacter sp.]